MASEQKKEEYQEYVRQNSPKTNLPLQMAKAFVMGGAICCLALRRTRRLRGVL